MQALVQVRAGLEAVVDRLQVDGDDARARARGAATATTSSAVIVIGSPLGEARAAGVDDHHVGARARRAPRATSSHQTVSPAT